jgi:hypothetical protein
MSEQTIGQAAHRAVTFLRELYQDVHAIIMTLDGRMADAGWHTPKDMGSLVSRGLGNGLHSPSWVLEYLTRIYVLNGPNSNATRAITFSIEFAPLQFDESVCLIVVADFAQPISIRRDLWDSWHSWDHVLERLAREQGPIVLTPGELTDGFMPAASRAQAFIVPLARLENEAALQQEVVTRALDLVTK